MSGTKHGLTMSFLWAEVDLATQSRAILEISTWSQSLLLLTVVTFTELTKIIDFFVVWSPVTPKLGHGSGGCKLILCQVTDRLTCIECQYSVTDGGGGQCSLGRSCSCWLVTAECMAVVPSVSSWRLARADWLLHCQQPQLGLRNQLLGTARGSCPGPARKYYQH